MYLFYKWIFYPQIIFTLLKMKDGHFQKILTHKEQSDLALRSIIHYTKPYDYLLEDQRQQILEILFWLGLQTFWLVHVRFDWCILIGMFDLYIFLRRKQWWHSKYYPLEGDVVLQFWDVINDIKVLWGPILKHYGIKSFILDITVKQRPKTKKFMDYVFSFYPINQLQICLNLDKWKLLEVYFSYKFSNKYFRVRVEKYAPV
jgi:hypothetical protein